MRKIKLFKNNYWAVDTAEEEINEWIKENKVNVLSTSTSVGGDYFITTIVYEEKAGGFSLNS